MVELKSRRMWGLGISSKILSAAFVLALVATKGGQASLPALPLGSPVAKVEPCAEAKGEKAPALASTKEIRLEEPVEMGEPAAKKKPCD